MRSFILLPLLVAVIAALPADLPEPGELAFVLGEEEFEDYLDLWLEHQNKEKFEASRTAKSSSGCELSVNGDLGQPQPVYVKDGDWLNPTGNTGKIHLREGEQVYIECTGSGRTIQHPNLGSTTASGWSTCEQGSVVSGAGWLNEPGEFKDITCSSHSYHEAEYTGETCYNGNQVIRVGFYVDDGFLPVFYSCFDSSRLEVLYVWYEQNPPNAVHQSGVTRPSWLVSSFFPGVGINSRYTQVNQKEVITELVGEELANKYVTSSQFLARGHLAAKTDFIYATGQRSTFYFINAAPQWQPFNAGNWNYLEQNLRGRIGVANYNTTVYTGTFGVSQLRDEAGVLKDVYLYTDNNNNKQLPVPLYFYKVVYEPTLKIGTAFVSINNPYYTDAEIEKMVFCQDHCRRTDIDWSWIGWNADRVDTGYSFCCTVDDFRKTIPHLPEFDTSSGLLY